eukprot:TRINITY_DN8076_c0_g1_i2.p3 TRINITY_DN8076_c0_g1~~TRINITY_DN8076_c0_g1_i2.p3  ORF type:complete len:172 (+),score=60.31 TRINITY_DN8076_c0_g1_i2:40-555(+)
MFYRNLIEACGVCEQKGQAAKIFQEIKKDLEPSVDTINAYFQACGRASISRKKSGEASEESAEDKRQRAKLVKAIDRAVVELSTKCKNSECDRYFREEEVLSAWSRSFDTFFIRCPKCGKEIIPTVDVQTSREKVEKFYFLFPPLFKKELNNLIENNTSDVFFTVSYGIKQ